MARATEVSASHIDEECIDLEALLMDAIGMVVRAKCSEVEMMKVGLCLGNPSDELEAVLDEELERLDLELGTAAAAVIDHCLGLDP